MAAWYIVIGTWKSKMGILDTSLSSRNVLQELRGVSIFRNAVAVAVPRRSAGTLAGGTLVQSGKKGVFT